ncbi:MAG TPA: PDZ domain-containing protein [Gammaproteobacteria bacterium]|nr:PDZ domain-containing protein [Gammaproteobacteria bacterium]
MLKTVLLVVAGLVAGLGIAFWLQPSSEPSVEAEVASGTATLTRSDVNAGLSEARLEALEDAFAAEIDQRVALEAHVAELSAQLEALGERPARGPSARENGSAGLDPAIVEQRARVRREAAAATPEERQRLAVERLIAAGFAPDRAEWINRRIQALRMQAMQAQYEARREGRPPPPDNLEATTLRTELGDQDYERFLTAQGRSTSVNVMGVLASSPAERVGLQAGDEIVSYDGKRVFDVQELNELTLGGTSGESVVVDVRRNGQNLQLVLPRGPIGVWGAAPGPPVRLQR